MPDLNPTRSLHRKIAEIVAEVDHVEKDGFNSQHNYAFTSEAAFLRALRGAMASRQLTMFPSVVADSVQVMDRKPDKGFITSCIVNYTISDGESGESITVSVASQGYDTLDKGAFKAMTGALKYALRQTFMLPTGDDPEGSDRPAGAASAKRNGNGNGPPTVQLPEGIFNDGTIYESKVIKSKGKVLWLTVAHVPNARGPVAEAKQWFQLDRTDQADAIEAQAVELGIVNPLEIANLNVPAEVESFDHGSLAGKPVTVIVEDHGDNRSITIGAPQAVTA